MPRLHGYRMPRLHGYREPWNDTATQIRRGILHHWFESYPNQHVTVSTWHLRADGTFVQTAGIFTPHTYRVVSLPMTITNQPTNLPAARVVRWSGKR